MQYGPNPNAVYPNEAIKSVCFIKNVITRPNITIGDYTYYDDVNGAEKFEEHVTHHYEFLGALEDLPYKGDTIVGNDVWLGQNVTVMPGVHISDGAIVGANSVVTKDIPAYHIAGGNPCKIIRKRFDDKIISYLQELKWWDWSPEKIFRNLEVLCSGDLEQIKNISEV